MIDPDKPAAPKRPMGLHVKISIAAACLLAVIVGIYYIWAKDQPPTVIAHEEIPGTVRRGDSNFDWYSRHVEISQIRSQIGSNYAGNRVSIVSGLIENMGDKTLEAVEIQVKIADEGKLMLDTRRWAQRITSMPIGPLKTRGFVCYIEPIPPDLVTGQTEVTLTGFKFSER
ncbi:MAG: hypothetical protein ACR2L2_02170 [Acidobacteriota bacterium]